MIRARRAWGPVLFLVIAVAALAVVSSRRGSDPLGTRPVSEQPKLLLLTSLPLIFGEDFALKGGGSPALTRLETRYRVVPISVTSQPDLAQGRLLLMAQPLAQTAENLVALDTWVRRGGRVVLLADPLLEWPSKRPLGDKLRPPAVFMDTGLLAHWGLRLAPPEQRGAAERRLGGVSVTTVSPGRLTGACELSPDGLVAHCRIGSGKATIVADADLLDVEILGTGAGENLDGLMRELAMIEQK